MQATNLVKPKLSVMETLRGFEVCSSCGGKYQWSPDGDCPNNCRHKVAAAEADLQNALEGDAQKLLLVTRLEAIGYSGDELQTKVREIQSQIVAASFIPRQPAPTFVPVTAGTIAKGVLLANVIVGLVVFVLILLGRLVS